MNTWILNDLHNEFAVFEPPKLTVDLMILSGDIDQIQYNIFGAQYPDPNMERAPQRIVKDLLAGIRPTHYKYMHKHMMDGKITPKLWSLCETGTVEREAQSVKDRKQMCKEWED